MQGMTAYGAIKAQRIIIGNKQGSSRFPATHIIPHVGIFRGGNIGRIGYYHIVPNLWQPLYELRCRLQGIACQETDSHMIASGIIGRYAQGIGRYIHRIHHGTRQVVRQSHGNGAASRTDIQYARSFPLTVVPNDPLHQFLRFGAGDQHPFGNSKG